MLNGDGNGDDTRVITMTMANAIANVMMVNMMAKVITVDNFNDDGVE